MEVVGLDEDFPGGFQPGILGLLRGLAQSSSEPDYVYTLLRYLARG